jgi:hypothetical protein
MNIAADWWKEHLESTEIIAIESEGLSSFEDIISRVEAESKKDNPDMFWMSVSFKLDIRFDWNCF